MIKRTRILTQRYQFDDWPSNKSFEAIEYDASGQLFWIAYDESPIQVIFEQRSAECCFPIDINMAEHIFETFGRKLDRSKLPKEVLHSKMCIS